MLLGDQINDSKVLVGGEGRGKENSLDELGTNDKT